MLYLFADFQNLNFQQLPVKFQDNFPRENKTTV